MSAARSDGNRPECGISAGRTRLVTEVFSPAAPGSPSCSLPIARALQFSMPPSFSFSWLAGIFRMLPKGERKGTNYFAFPHLPPVLVFLGRAPLVLRPIGANNKIKLL